MADNSFVPIPQDKIGESFVWRDWFQKISNKVFGTIADGGTGGTATPTAGAVAYGTGTAYAFTAVGTAGQVLTSAAAGTPTWTTALTTGTSTSILYGNGTGGFNNVTIGSGVSFAAGTLSATGSGGTVTSVGWTGGIVSVATSTTTPAFTIAGTSGGIPYFSNGTTWASSGVLTASRLVLGGGAGTAPTVLGSLGTTTTVLHGNAAGAPTFGAVSLTADVSGILPIANGGTGTSTAGVSATIVTAKLTSLGADGSMTFTNGLLTAQTPAT